MFKPAARTVWSGSSTSGHATSCRGHAKKSVVSNFWLFDKVDVVNGVVLIRRLSGLCLFVSLQSSNS